MAIPVVNRFDKSVPTSFKYSKKRTPIDCPAFKFDEKFLCGCDCTDQCLVSVMLDFILQFLITFFLLLQDKSKCQCWQMTLARAELCKPGKSQQNVGYSSKRLYRRVPTGIFECNLQCKCNDTCLNRVVQHGLNMKLEVFKTTKRGWGVRCVDEIPEGAFICSVTGNMLTATNADAADSTYTCSISTSSKLRKAR